MSNLKKIDGLYINLDNVLSIEPANRSENKLWNIEIHGISGYYSMQETSVFYKTKQEAEARIDEILINQNSDKTEI